MKYQSGAEFIKSENKSITLLGMSGVGKSHLAALLAGWGWFSHSCDVEIATRSLADELKSVHQSPKVSTGNISALSAYIGKPGEMPLAEFKRRQKQYYDAEVIALARVPELAAQHVKFVNDSTGSLCEIEDDAVISQLGAASLLVYIKAGKDEEVEILKRAEEYPKPLYYPPQFFDAWLAEYRQIFNIKDEAELDADDVTRWMFPRLFETRLPKYQNLADQYGVSLTTKDVYQVKTEKDLMNLIAEAF